MVKQINKQIYTELARLLEDELYLCKQLLKLEKLKNDFIITHDIEKLQHTVTKEEEYIQKLSEIEEERDKLVKEYTGDKKLTFLIEKIPEEDKELKELLKHEKKELVIHLKEIKKMSELNHKLLIESIQFFNYIVNSIFDTEEVVYQPGKETNKNEKTSFFIDRQI